MNASSPVNEQSNGVREKTAKEEEVLLLERQLADLQKVIFLS